MANIPHEIKNWSTTEGSNQPDGTDLNTIVGDLRAIQVAVRWLRSGFVDVASAATTDLGAQNSESLRITGTTTITSLGTVSAGIIKRVVFTGSLTLTHSATLLLPGSANIQTQAGDAAIFESLGAGNWRCINYQPFAQAPTIVFPVEIQPGSRMFFAQASAPTGWTQDVTTNDRMLRVVAGAGGAIFGTHSPTIMNVVPAHTHGFTTGGNSVSHTHSGTTGTQSANHTHDYTRPTLTNVADRGNNTSNWQIATAQTLATTSNSVSHTHSFTTGGISQNHTHSGGTDGGSSQTNWEPRILDVILCTKD